MKPSPARLSRAEQQERNRERLLEAAVARVRKGGLTALSVSEVAADAGLTTGAVYSNFKGGLADLMLAVTEHLAGPAVAMPPIDAGRESWLRGVAAVIGDHTDNEESVALATEMLAAAFRNDSVRALAGVMAAESLSSLSDQIGDQVDGDSRFSSEELAVLVMGMFAGLSQLRVLLGADAVPLELCARAFEALAGSRADHRQSRRG